MMDVRVFCWVTALAFALTEASVEISRGRVSVEAKGYTITLLADEEVKLRTTFHGFTDGRWTSTKDGLLLTAPAGASLQIRADEDCANFEVNGLQGQTLLACHELADLYWYSGIEQWQATYLLEQRTYSDYSWVPKESDFAAVVSPYWLNSNGTYIFVSPGAPLFIDLNSRQQNQLCLVTKLEDPYPTNQTGFVLRYSVCSKSDLRAAHESALQNFLGKPSGTPDFRMVQHPIWSTWARYKSDINEQKVLEFADEIIANGFNNSQLEIDDLWETCYGSLTIDTSRFPDMAALTQTLSNKGFRATMWVHPFINKNCEPWYSDALNNGYLVLNTAGSPDTRWWNGEAGIVDMTQDASANWWLGRLRSLLDASGLLAFKFDAGEGSFMPQPPVLNVPNEENPVAYSVNFARRIVNEFTLPDGPALEIRVGYGTQDLPAFVRVIDKDSRWGLDNGLQALIVSVLQMNLAGYPFVLPDMVGGNGYGTTPSKELFIRWLQANTFMPTIQLSYTPWDYDQETVDISRKFTALHAQYADRIFSLMQSGGPVNPPIWWIAPNDPAAQFIADEFLLGEDLLVAPVLSMGATSRNVFLPAGRWQSGNNPNEYLDGPVMINDYPAPLDTLPYFLRVAA